MSWVFNHKVTEKHRVCFFIGQAQISEIAPFKASRAEKWSYYLRTLNEDTKFPTFAAALSALHQRLNSPPPEGHKTGRIWS
jgi:hypothetical protein